MARLEVHRAKCSFSVCCGQDSLDAPTKTATEARSVPTSPNFLRSANINTLSLNNKVNENIQFFSKLGAKTIDEGNLNTAPSTSPKVTARSKDKSPVRPQDKENGLCRERKERAEDVELDKSKEKEENIVTVKQERVKVLLELPTHDQRTSKSSEDLSRMTDKVNEKDVKNDKDLRELFLSFKEGDRFRVLSKEWELWWAVRSLDSSQRVGLVQAQLLEKTDDEVFDDEEVKDMDHIDSNVKASLEELRKRIGEKDPDGIYSDAMIPEEMERINQRNQPLGHGGLMGGLGGLGKAMPSGGSPSPLVNSEGLILPRKPANPCLDSKEKQNLHRELMFNNKIGKNVLNQKSELQRALQKHKEHQIRKEAEQQKQQNKTDLQQIIEERARRLESKEKSEDKNGGGPEPEFMKVHAKLRAKMEPK